jgi:hypothetical protein
MADDPRFIYIGTCKHGVDVAAYARMNSENAEQWFDIDNMLIDGLTVRLREGLATVAVCGYCNTELKAQG